jgi:hypothetical protein
MWPRVRLYGLERRLTVSERKAAIFPIFRSATLQKLRPSYQDIDRHPERSYMKNRADDLWNKLGCGLIGSFHSEQSSRYAHFMRKDGIRWIRAIGSRCHTCGEKNVGATRSKILEGSPMPLRDFVSFR